MEMNPDNPDLSYGDFYCQVCDTHINSELTWSSHIVGKRHMKNVEKEIPESTRHDFAVDTRKDLKKALKYAEGPIVGLSNICEYIRRQSSYFNCFLCSAILPTPIGLVEHVTSLDHKLNYIKHVEPEQHKSILDTQLSKEYLTPLVDEKCCELVNRLGQGEVMVKLEKSQKNEELVNRFGQGEVMVKQEKYEKHEDRVNRFIQECMVKKEKYQKNEDLNLTPEREQDLRVKLNKKRSAKNKDHVKQDDGRRRERSLSSDDEFLTYIKKIKYEIRQNGGHRRVRRRRERHRRECPHYRRERQRRERHLSPEDFRLKCKKVIEYEIKKDDGRRKERHCEREPSRKRIKYGDSKHVASEVTIAQPTQTTNSSNKMWLNKSFTKGLPKIPNKNFIDLVSKKLDTIEENEVEENLYLLHAIAFRCQDIFQKKMSDIIQSPSS